MELKDIRQPRSRFRKVNRVDLVTMSIAREAVLLDLGDRMRTVDDYVDMFDVSRGTVQKALSRLENSGAVSIEKRGVLGSFLKDRDRDILWYEAAWDHVTGAGAISRTRRQEALASSVYTAFEEAKVPLSLAYLQGSLRRVQGLLANQYDFVLASKCAADLILQQYTGQIEIAIALKPYSYLSGYTIVTRVGGGVEDAKRVGIDSNSPDHAIVTRRVFFQCVLYIPLADNGLLLLIHPHLEFLLDGGAIHRTEIVHNLIEHDFAVAFPLKLVKCNLLIHSLPFLL
jgi:DNA-binding transcriptional regulator YhcF (GntR family)